jgi:hypothetical protein
MPAKELGKTCKSMIAQAPRHCRRRWWAQTRQPQNQMNGMFMPMNGGPTRHKLVFFWLFNNLGSVAPGQHLTMNGR